MAHTRGCSAASRSIRERVCGVQGTYQSMGVPRELSSMARIALYPALGDRRGHVAHLVQQVGAEEHAGRLVVEVAGVPAVRQVRGGQEAQGVRAGREGLAVGELPHLAERVVADAHEGAVGAARGLRVPCLLQPVVERPALVRLEVAEGDPAQRLGVHDLPDGVAHPLEHAPRAGVVEQRLLVADQELAELQIGLLDVRADAEDVRRDLADGGHLVPSLVPFGKRGLR